MASIPHYGVDPSLWRRARGICRHEVSHNRHRQIAVNMKWRSPEQTSGLRDIPIVHMLLAMQIRGAKVQA